MKYDHKQVEKKWQDIWDEKQCFHAENDSDKEKFYALVEFPYPSGPPTMSSLEIGSS